MVNLLVRREAGQVDQLLSVGAALRDAQAAMSAGELRALTKQRRQVTAAVTDQARHLAAEAGHKVTQAVADQVEATLTAAMVDADCGRAVRSGLLVAALQTTGIDPVGEVALAAALATPEALGFSATAREAPEPGPPALRVVPDPDAAAKARAAVAERLDQATASYDQADGAHAEAVADVDRLSARSLQLQAELDELEAPAGRPRERARRGRRRARGRRGRAGRSGGRAEDGDRGARRRAGFSRQPGRPTV